MKNKFNCRNPIYNRFNSVDCEIEHPEYGWIPFTASPSDPEEYGRDLYNEIIQSQNIAPYQPPSDDAVAEEIRSIRNSLITKTDWTQLPDVPEKIKSEWAAYRQALRDVPEQPDFPYNIVWPDKPNS